VRVHEPFRAIRLGIMAVGARHRCAVDVSLLECGAEYVAIKTAIEEQIGLDS
jgi:hypothetical protein